jgi:hypothetical protein
MDLDRLYLYAEKIGKTEREDLKSSAMKTVYSLYRAKKIGIGEKKVLEGLLCYNYPVLS